MDEEKGGGEDLIQFGNSVDVEQSEYEERVINDYNERIRIEEERKRKENENLLLRIRSEIEKVENVLRSTKDTQVILVQKSQLKQLHLKEKGVEKVLKRKKSVPQEEVTLVQREKEKEKMISMGILTPFEALSKGHDQTRSSKTRMQRTDLQPDSQSPRTSFRPRFSKTVNRQNLRNRKIKIDPNREKNRLRNYKKRKRVKSPTKKSGESSEGKSFSFRDDGDDFLYTKRLKTHYKEQEVPYTVRDANFDFTQFFDSKDDVYFEGGFKLPGKLHKKLFNYQATGVKWLWQLHQQSVGGILGDEMGLGKTIEVIGFLGGLHYSGLFSPSLVVVPATVLSQWVEEFHLWWPYFKVVLLHSSGTYYGYTKDTISEVAKSQNGIIVTTYESIRIYTELYTRHEWGYMILDEGHKIRNPNSEVTLAVKRINTPHRILMTGTPIQNTLKELWSQFDFVFPGLLGTLPVFQTQFGIPISQGQYSNASEFQVYTAYRCARHLRDLIQPYLLRRMKKDVGHQLPRKRERILFCRLSPLQLRLYRQYLRTKEVKDVSERRKDKNTGMVFKVLSILRQICNHPDILVHDENKKKKMLSESNKEELSDDEEYGKVYKSGKLKVVEEIMGLWKKNGHKVLLYSQSLKMLDILELFVKRKNYVYLRMDGGTTISKRLSLVNKFNDEKLGVFVFLLTTKVGGIGINLTGADRILLFDPDWNPSTDVQAMERSWRIGQTREVHVYRLMTSGTIEEKIYHRQIFKQFLTNKILQDPKQKRFFKENRLRDLFQLGKEYDGVVFDSEGEVCGMGTSARKGPDREASTETSSMFKKSEIGYDMLKMMIRKENETRMKIQNRERRMRDEDEEEEEEERDEDVDDDEDEEEEKENRRRRRRRRRKRRKSSSSEVSNSGDIGNNEQQQQQKKKKKKKKKMKSIVKVERVKYGKDGGKGNSKKNSNGSKETSILKHLFDSESIHNIIDHEIISEGNKSKILIERESKKIADEAIRKIRESQQEIRSRPGFSYNKPTWTGEKGVDGNNEFSSLSGGGGGQRRRRSQTNKFGSPRFGKVKRSRVTASNFKPSRLVPRPLPRYRVIRKKKKKKREVTEKNSEDDDVVIVPPPNQAQMRISANRISSQKGSVQGNKRSSRVGIFGGIKKKGGLASSEVISRINSQGDSSGVDESIEMIRRIVAFFRINGYRRIETKEIVSHFNQDVKGEKRFLFRTLLRQAAQIMVDGKWLLRKEFHSTT